MILTNKKNHQKFILKNIHNISKMFRDMGECFEFGNYY